MLKQLALGYTLVGLLGCANPEYTVLQNRSIDYGHTIWTSTLFERGDEQLEFETVGQEERHFREYHSQIQGTNTTEFYEALVNLGKDYASLTNLLISNEDGICQTQPDAPTPCCVETTAKYVAKIQTLLEQVR